MRFTGPPGTLAHAERLAGEILDNDGVEPARDLGDPTLLRSGNVADDAELAVAQYRAAAARGPTTSTDMVGGHPGDFASQKLEIPVPRFAVGSVIGQRGEMIKRIQAESGGARVQFDQADQSPGDRTCFITGTKDMVRVAQRLVLDIIEEQRARGPPGGATGVFWWFYFVVPFLYFI
jgi:hypothetical protein